MILVNGVKKLKSWFFEPTAAGFKRGTRFLDNDKPQEQAFRNWVESAAFKTEVDDQAKDDDSSGALADKAGLVVSATDAQAKAGDSVSGRTLATKPKHLPQTASAEQTFTFEAPEGTQTLTSELIKVNNDPTTRNNYTVRLGEAFKTLLEGLFAATYSFIDYASTEIADISNELNAHSDALTDLQNQINGIIVPGADTIIADTTDYKLIRNINGNDFTIRLLVKKSCTLTNLVLIPAGIAQAMTIDDARYIAYGPTQNGDYYRYDLTVTFNKLKSDATYVIGGNAYNLNLRLYDNVGDFNNVDGFNYAAVGGTGDYQIPYIATSGFQINSGVFAATAPNSVIEFVFKGSFVGKI